MSFIRRIKRLHWDTLCGMPLSKTLKQFWRHCPVSAAIKPKGPKGGWTSGMRRRVRNWLWRKHGRRRGIEREALHEQYGLVAVHVKVDHFVHQEVDHPPRGTTTKTEVDLR